MSGTSNTEAFIQIYFPKHQRAAKEKLCFLLQDIDANMSRIVQQLLPSMTALAEQIAKDQKNFRHYNWEVMLEERRTRKWVTRLPLNIKPKPKNKR